MWSSEIRQSDELPVIFKNRRANITFSLNIKRIRCSLLKGGTICIIAFVTGKMLLAGEFLRRTVNFNGGWELCKYGRDAYGEVKV